MSWLPAAPDVRFLGPEGGDVRSLAAHPARPEQVFLGTTDGQIFVSHDFGRSWTRLLPGIGRRELVLDALAIQPRDPDEIWVGGWELRSDRGALFVSRDGGRSFTPVSLGAFDSAVRAIALSPADGSLVAVGINEGVLLSRDGGKTWDRITRGYRSLHYVHSLAFDPRDPELLYVGTFRLGWKTPDLGKKWIPIHDGMFWDSDLFSFQVHPRNPEVLLVGACSGVYRSTNAGGKWERLRRGIPDEAKRTRVVRFDPQIADRWYAGTTEGLFRSDDGGDSWRLILPGVVVNTLLIHPKDSRRILVGADDVGVLRSEDGGNTFEPGNRGFAQLQVSAVAARRRDGKVQWFAGVVAGSGRGGFYWRDAEPAAPWRRYSDGLPEGVTIRCILPGNRGDLVVLGTAEGVYVGVPGSRSWTRLPGTRELEVAELAWSDESEAGILAATGKGLFLLEAAAERPPKKISLPVYDRAVLCLARDESGGRIYAGTEMGVFRADSAEGAWRLVVEGLPYLPVRDVVLVRGRLLAATDEGVFFSDNGGDRWHRVDRVFPVPVSALAASPRGLVVAAEPVAGYLFWSFDGGNFWTAAPMAQEVSRITSLAAGTESDFIAGTVGEGVVQVIWSEPVATSPSSAPGNAPAAGESQGERNR
ncbi:MAG: hypothetical protein Kow00109_16250 [Acidobacteriota bacterium]